MFDRVSFNYQSEDYGPAGMAKMGEIMKTFSHQTALLDVEAAIKSAAEGGKVGITGYCFGGSVSWRAAVRQVSVSAPPRAITAVGCPTISSSIAKCPDRDAFRRQGHRHPASNRSKHYANAHPEAGIYLYSGPARLLQFRPPRPLRRSRLQESLRPLAGFLPQASGLVGKSGTAFQLSAPRCGGGARSTAVRSQSPVGVHARRCRHRPAV